MLYLVATPIGNLGDIALRALEVLRTVDLILCEDTRHSGHLLRHYEIQSRLTSYHKFNELEKEEWIVQELKMGKSIALISDAGTPLVADPGARLVKRCRKEGIPITALPGPCAALVALTLSGFSAEKFQFLGFLPKQPSELKKWAEELLEYSGTTICYESPHRIVKSLELFFALAPDRRFCLARELTKAFEEVLIGLPGELLFHFDEKDPRGEYVLLIEGNPVTLVPSNSFSEDLLCLQSHFSLSKQEAIRLVAQLRGVPKREVYQSCHKKDSHEEDLLL